jgi:SOS-response transcriptional repressor LexA
MVRETYEIVKKYIADNKIAPSIKEIVDRASYASKSSAIKSLRELEEKGYIALFKTESGKVSARGIVILKDQWEE